MITTDIPVYPEFVLDKMTAAMLREYSRRRAEENRHPDRLADKSNAGVKFAQRGNDWQHAREAMRLALKSAGIELPGGKDLRILYLDPVGTLALGKDYSFQDTAVLQRLRQLAKIVREAGAHIVLCGTWCTTQPFSNMLVSQLRGALKEFGMQLVASVESTTADGLLAHMKTLPEGVRCVALVADGAMPGMQDATHVTDIVHTSINRHLRVVFCFGEDGLNETVAQYVVDYFKAADQKA